MKKCPYCAEDIQDKAVLCRYCGKAFKKGNVGPVPWCYKFGVIFSLGPLGIPLILFHPKLNPVAKAIWIIMVIVATLTIAFAVWFLWPTVSVAVENIRNLYDYNWLEQNL